MILDPINQLAWQHQAACRSEPPELWDATPGAFETTETRIATAVCNDRCPVKAECLQWALDTEEPFNILGGMLPRERAVEQTVRRMYGTDYATD